MIIKTDQDEIENYLIDASNLHGYAEKLIIPENTTELGEIIQELYSKSIPYTISGAGTGLVGGRVPFEGVIISMEKLNKILEINIEEKRIHLQGGVVYAEMEKELKENGLFLPPNPTEKNAFIGANIACNSSGSRTFKYGTFRDYVMSIKLALPDGEIIDLRRDEKYRVNEVYRLETQSGKIYSFPIPKINYPNVQKNSAGYFLREGMNLIDLFIGSEGTLGTIIEAELRIEKLTEKVLGLIVFFDDLSQTLEFVDEVRRRSYHAFESGTNPANPISARVIEFFDNNSLALLLNEYPQIPSYSQSAIWIEQEYLEEDEDLIINFWLELISKYSKFTDYTWVAMNDQEHERFRVFRHRIPQKVFELVARSRFQKVGSDAAVPDFHFRRYYFDFIEMLKNAKIQYYVWGHIGNSHVHTNLIPQLEEENQLASEIYEKSIAKAIELGGTFSAEHGTGKLKRKYLEMMYGSKAISEMKKIKLLFDPKNLVGKGNLFF